MAETSRKWIGGLALALGLTLLGLEVGTHVVAGFHPAVARALVPVPISGLGPAGASADAEAREHVASFGGREIHPFLGYTFSVQSWKEALANTDGRWNELGFDGPVPRSEPVPGEFWVALVGGSVARQVAVDGRQHLEAALAALPGLEGKQPRVVSLSLDGFKQPQQAAAVAWVATLGLHLDAVINLDGFNEVMLPHTHGWPAGLSPAFPRHWEVIGRSVLGPRALAQLGRVQRLQEDASWWSRLHAHPRLGWSAFLRSMVGFRAEAARNQVVRGEQELRRTLGGDGEVPRRALAGPGDTRGGPEHAVASSVEIWARSSVQISAVARAMGARYLHALQPNQYDPGSKPMGEEELDVAFDEEGETRGAVLLGYPMLRAKAEVLRRAGVAFQDLSRLFENVEEPVYVDDCCHFNDDGIRRLAEALADGLQRILSGEPIPEALLRKVSDPDAPPLVGRPARAAERYRLEKQGPTARLVGPGGLNVPLEDGALEGTASFLGTGEIFHHVAGWVVDPRGGDAPVEVVVFGAGGFLVSGRQSLVQPPEPRYRDTVMPGFALRFPREWWPEPRVEDLVVVAFTRDGRASRLPGGRLVKGLEACGFCRSFPVAGELVTCPTCAGKVHQECWDYIGSCPSYGCRTGAQPPKATQ